MKVEDTIKEVLKGEKPPVKSIKINLKVMFEKGIDPGDYRIQGTKINTVDTPD